MPRANANGGKAADADEDQGGEDVQEDDTTDARQPTLQLEGQEAVGFMKFFQSMEEPPPSTIRFFHRKKDGDYYSCHGADALFIAQECYHTLSVVKYMGKENDFAGVAVSPANFNSFAAQLLTQKQHRIEVWSETKGAGKGWSIVRQGSPGNLESFEDVVFEMGDEAQDTPTAVAVQLALDAAAGWRVGLAYCDNTLKVLGMSEFLDSDQLTNLEAALVRLGAKECVVAEDKVRAPVEGRKLREVLERCDVVLTERKARDFATKDAAQDLGRLLGAESGKALLGAGERPHGLAAAACLIRYLDLLADEALHGRFKLQELVLDGCMRLDKAAVRALNLLPQPQDGNRNMSLYALLNKCKTPVGSRLLMRWVKQPLLDPAEINARLDLVETFFTDVQLRQAMQEIYLRHVPDLARLARKLQKQSKATLMDAWRLYQFVQQLPQLRQALEECDAAHGELLASRVTAPLRALEADFKQYERLVEQSLDLEGIDSHEYRISPRYSPDLKALAEQKEEVKADVEAQRGVAARKLGLADDKVKLERNKDKIYTFRITRKDEKALRSKAATFQTLETRKDGVKFTSRELKPLAERYRQLDDEYGAVQASLVAKVMEIIASYAPAVEQLCDVVAELDVLVALAHVASNAPTPYVRPALSAAGEGDLVLREARHPCVEMMDDVAFIANDVELRRKDARLQVVTGPNMGGKSTYIRQAGVIVLMAQIGSFVPCSEAEVPVCHAIHARIGAGDNQVKGVSTFMQEMLDTAAILGAADDKSLVIIDELGRGTSTYDGFGLAWAISEHICTEIRAPCLFATHFHELTELEHAAPAVANRHVTAHVEGGKLTMLYQVRAGACDQSFGIHVAEMAQFPPHVVAMAKRKAAELETFASAGGAGAEEGAAEGAGGSGSPETLKKRRTDADAPARSAEDAAGAKLVLDFLRDFAALPLEGLPPAEACAKAMALRDRVAAENNSFVQRLLTDA